MNNVDRIVITIYFVVLLILITRGFGICIYKLEELDKKIDNLNQLKQDSCIIEVNRKLIDSNYYYKVNLKNCTLVKDSIE